MKRAWPILAAMIAAGCSSAPTSDNGGPAPQDDAGSADEEPAIGNDAGGDGSTCKGLACQVVDCGKGIHTTLTGTVFDPMGRTPLYNAYVYVPNAPLQDIPSGSVACTQCQAPASGSPLPGAAQTDAKGRFQLVDVPVGTNIPLVMQIGKFRRQIAVAKVDACVDNTVGKKDSLGYETLTRLPRSQHEGVGGVANVNDNLPQIAMATGGCDQLECLLRKIGIADSEFGSTGRVHVFEGTYGASAPGSTDAYAFWSDKTELMKYDMVLNGCECNPFTRPPAALTAVHDYVDSGGRLFASHYHYNWFSPPSGPADFQSTAQWGGSSGGGSPYAVNTAFPKGQAFSDWLQNIFASAPPPMGQIVINGGGSPIDDVGQALGSTTPWITYGDPDLTKKSYSTAYLSFNAPVSMPPAQQCGRAVFSDFHVSQEWGDGINVFPHECGPPVTTPLTQQEAALEFLLFDLSSCVQDDAMPPPPLPPN